MPTPGKPLTVHDAARIQSEWAAGQADLDDIGRALDTLVWALGQRDRAVRVMRRLAEGPWSDVKEVVGELEAWLGETDPPPLKKPAAARRRWGSLLRPHDRAPLDGRGDPGQQVQFSGRRRPVGRPLDREGGSGGEVVLLAHTAGHPPDVDGRRQDSTPAAAGPAEPARLGTVAPAGERPVPAGERPGHRAELALGRRAPVEGGVHLGDERSDSTQQFGHPVSHRLEGPPERWHKGGDRLNLLERRQAGPAPVAPRRPVGRLPHAAAHAGAGVPGVGHITGGLETDVDHLEDPVDAARSGHVS
jgi:hypothetical protein